MPSPDAIQRDANHVPIHGKYPFIVSKEVTFTAGGNGAVGAIDLFTVTGDVPPPPLGWVKVISAVNSPCENLFKSCIALSKLTINYPFLQQLLNL